MTDENIIKKTKIFLNKAAILISEIEISELETDKKMSILELISNKALATKFTVSVGMNTAANKDREWHTE